MTNEQYNTLMETMGAIFVQLTRIYEVLIVNFADNSKIAELVDLQQEGRTVSPPPALVYEEIEEEDK